MVNINNLLTRTNKSENKIKIHMDDPTFISESVQFINNKIDEISNKSYRPIITVCIGTDRSTGDSLGPLVGWSLEQKLPYNTFIYGTIDNPVHATNLQETFDNIHKIFNNPLIIAVDACLGKVDSVGCVSISQGSLRPGAAVNKDLPAIGDLAISGIINVGGFMEYFVLQNTRLSLVMKMADKISQILADVYKKNRLAGF